MNELKSIKMAEVMFDAVKKLFSIFEFKEFQLDAMKSLLNGKDVFVEQPTGSGKSLIYLALPFLHGKVVKTPLTSSSLCIHGRKDSINIESNKCVLVVSPLESLMSDQTAKLKIWE